MKVGHKTRRGRKANPAPHKGHRTAHGVVRDPISRAMKRVNLLRRREDDERVERAAWDGAPLDGQEAA